MKVDVDPAREPVPRTAGTSATRMPELDAAKGIGIILVVLFHVYRGIIEAKGTLPQSLSFFDYLAYCFHMPLFFVLAGIFVPRSLNRGAGEYVRVKLISVYWPYLLWSVVTIVVSWALASFVNKPMALGSLATIPVLPRLHFWFLLTLFVFYMVALAIRDARLLIGLGLVLLIVRAAGFDPALLDNYLHFAIFFAVGVAGFLPASRLWPVSLALLILCAALGYAYGVDTRSILLVPAAFAGYHVTLAAARAVQGHVVGNFLNELGERSLVIYLLHILAASGARIVLTHLFHDVPGLLSLVICTDLGILLPLLAFVVARRLRLLTVLGLGKDARAFSLPRRRAVRSLAE